MFGRRLNRIGFENRIYSQYGPDLAALFGDHCKADFFICETAPRDLAERGQRGAKFFGILAAEITQPARHVLAKVFTFLIWLLNRITR